VHREAPALKPAEQAPALRTIAAWLHWRLRDSRNRIESLQGRTDDVEAALRELRTYQPTVGDPDRDVVSRIASALGGQYGDDVGGWRQRVEVDDVVAALQDLGGVYARRDEALRTLKYTRTELESAQRNIARLLGEMDKAAT
jgi:prefoldin subunit 5